MQQRPLLIVVMDDINPKQARALTQARQPQSEHDPHIVVLSSITLGRCILPGSDIVVLRDAETVARRFGLSPSELVPPSGDEPALEDLDKWIHQAIEEDSGYQITGANVVMVRYDSRRSQSREGYACDLEVIFGPHTRYKDYDGG